MTNQHSVILPAMLLDLKSILTYCILLGFVASKKVVDRMLSPFKCFNLKYCFIIFEQIMVSNANNNGLPVENTELYHEVFEVLNNLRMADLKQTFQEHCIQVNMYILVIWWCYEEMYIIFFKQILEDWGSVIGLYFRNDLLPSVQLKLTGGSVGWASGCYVGGHEFDCGRTNTQGLK